MGLGRLLSPARLRAAHLRAALPSGQAGGLALASFIDWSGTGVWLTTSTVLMVRVVHLSPTQVGLGLTAGGVLGLAAVWPVTMATRRWRVRRVAMTVQVLRGLFFLSFLLVRSAPVYYLAAALVAIVDRPATSVNQILVSRYVPDKERTATLAIMHVATNAGVMIGALLASTALLLPSRVSLDVVVTVNSLSFLAAAWQVGKAAAGPEFVPPAASEAGAGAGGGAGAGAGGPRAGHGAHKAGRGRHAAVRARLGWRFLLVTVGCGVLALLFPLFNVEIPLWLTTRTSAPTVTVSALFLLNTVLVVVFQTRLTRWVTGIRAGVRAGAAAGLCVICCCGLLAVLPGLATWAATAGFVLAALLVALAEMNQGSAAWTLSFGLSQEGDKTHALAVFNVGQAAAFVLGPALCTSAVGWGGRAGYAIIAAIVVAGIGCVAAGARRAGGEPSSTLSSPKPAGIG